MKSREDVIFFFKSNPELRDYFILQEYIHGLSDRMYTIGIYANQQHEVMGVFTGRKVRGYPAEYGDCIVGQAEKIPQELVEITKKICREIGYQGIAEFEFKRDSVSNEFRLIEINPRSWSWVGITPACGVSLPWLLYSDLIGSETTSYKQVDIPNGSIMWMRVLDDLFNCLYVYKREGHSDWSMSLRQWIKSIRGKKVIFAEFSCDDPIVGIYSIIVFLLKKIKLLFSLKK